MNTRSVNSAAGVILAAMSKNRTAAGIALALEAAGLLTSPEAAADMASASTDAVGVAEQAVVELRREHEESARLRDRLAMYDALELGGLDGRVSASCENPEHPTWLRVKDDKRVCPWCLAEMQNVSLTAQRHELEKYQRIECEREANQRVDGSLAAVANLRIAELNRERDALQARVAELEAERHVTNEALDDAVKALRSDRDRIASLERGPALPWAHAMSDDDLHGFLGDLVSAAMNRWRHNPEVPDRVTLAEVEQACVEWRTPGQGYRSDEPGPSVEESPDALTRTFAPTAALREDLHDGSLHHSYRVPRDLPELGGAL